MDHSARSGVGNALASNEPVGESAGYGKHPTDSHPALVTRLTALGVDARSFDIETLCFEQTEPAIELVEAYEQIEVSLTQLVANDQSEAPGAEAERVAA